MRALRVRESAASAIVRGSPWVYREAVSLRGPGPETGEVVELHGAAGFLAVALWDAGSPLAARVLSRGRERVDESFVLKRIVRAIELRERLVAGEDTDAYRLVAGEGDRLPGLVLDRYASVGVLRLDGAGWEPWLDRLREPLAAELGRRGVGSLGLRVRDGEPRFRLLSGPPPEDPTWVREEGVLMEVSVGSGQKTGAFLDQRENRSRVRALTARLAKAGPVRALNLFSYTGGFSVAAALGGATEVTSVDSAAPAVAAATRAFRRNGLDPAAHRFVVGDVFAFLERARTDGRTFDLVVSDPPSFAPSERAKPSALKAYRRLHAACAGVLAPGGVLLAASCSSHVDLVDFLGTLDDESLGRSDLRVLETHGNPADHPTLASWPEGRYLKLVMLA